MVLKLYGFPFSTATRRVALVCKELDIPYEFINIDLTKGEHKAPEYLALHPFGQVPFIDDNGFQLYESRAICRYLAMKAGSSLLPRSGLHAVANFEKAVDVEQSTFDATASKVLYEKFIKKIITGIEPDEEVIAQLVETLNSKLVVYDAILSKQKYLAGDEVTLADLFHLPAGYTLEAKAGCDIFQNKPNVARWWKDISSRPSWQSVKDGP